MASSPSSLGESACESLRKLAGMLWITVDHKRPQDVIDSDKCFIIALLSFTHLGPTGWRGLRPYLEKDLCSQYGDLIVLERLKSTYLQCGHLHPKERRALLYWTPRLMDTSHFYPHFKSTNSLIAVRAAYDYRIEEIEKDGDLTLELEAVQSMAWMA